MAADLESTNWVPSWFTVSIKTGSLVLHLDYPSCFDAEVFAEDIGVNIPQQKEEKLPEAPQKHENGEKKTENGEKKTELLDETTGKPFSWPILCI